MRIVIILLVLLSINSFGGDEIYNNQFHDIGVGVQPQGQTALNSNEGLQIKCNDFTDNILFYHIAVPSGDISDPQGNCPDINTPPSIAPTLPAGNTFTHECIFTGGDLGTHPADGFVYNHHFDNNGPLTPICYSSTVNPNPCTQLQGPFDKQTICPSHFTTPCCDYAEMMTHVGTISATLTSIELLIDGGNTQGLITMIQQQPNAGTVKNALLAASPYLSDQVLLAYIKKNHPYPPGNLLQVLLANSSLTDTVMNAIINRIPPLPPGILKQILAAQTGISARTELESEISYLQMQLGIAINNLNRAYLNDTTITNPLDSVIVLFEQFSNENNINKLLVNVYLANGQFTDATAILNTFSSDPYYSNFVFVQQQFINLTNQGKNWFEIQNDSALKQNIETIAQDTLKPGFLEARAILTMVFGTYFPEHIDEIIVPSAKWSGNGNEDNAKTYGEEIAYPTMKEIELPEKDGTIKVYPNPAKERINVEYSFTSTHNAEIKMYDVLGHRYDYTLKGETGITTIDLAKMNSGLYYYTIIVNNNTIAREKIIILK